MKSLSLFVQRSAEFSECRLYRYSLRIVWGTALPLASFVGLNPSTADEWQDDPTVRRCRTFAESWNCGGLLIQCAANLVVQGEVKSARRSRDGFALFSPSALGIVVGDEATASIQIRTEAEC